MRALRFLGDTAIALVPSNIDELRDGLSRVLEAGKREKAIAVDVETTGLRGTDTVRLAQLGTDSLVVVAQVEGNALYVDAIKEFLEEAVRLKLTLTAHNSTFDMLHLDRLCDVDSNELLKLTDDTLVLATLIEQPRKRGGKALDGRFSKDALVQTAERDAGTPLPQSWLGLKTLVADWLPRALADTAERALETEYLSLGLTKENYWRDIPLDNVAYLRYAAADVIDTARLHSLLKPTAVTLCGQPVLDRERAMLAFAGRVRKRGFRLDITRIDREILERGHGESKLDALRKELLDEFGIENPNSGMQIARAIERETGTLPTVEDADGYKKISTNKDVLKLTTGKCAAKVLAYRKRSKLDSTYGAGWKDKYADADGVIHPSLNPLGSSTGRMTMSEPSLLNVPDESRSYVIAEPGSTFVQADLSAVEVRIGGALAGDRRMYDDLVGGADPYSIVASEAFGEAFTKADRNACKPILLGRMYGRSAASLARTEKVRNPDADLAELELEARRIMSTIDRRWPDLKKAAYREAALTKAGRTRIRLDSGRCISLDLVGARDTFNALVQGSGREILVDAAMRLIERGYEKHLWLPVHDEWILQVPESRAEQAVADLAECMTSTFRGVPLITEAKVLGRTWRKG